MGKRQIAALETRKKLILAAEKLIRERGFEGVSVEDVAREAGVAKGTFYTYFRRKEEVVDVIAHNRFVIAEKEAGKEETALGQISAFLTESMKYIFDTGLPVCRQWLKNVVEPEDEQGKSKLAYDAGVIRKALDAAVERGELKKDAPTGALADSIAASYYGIVTVWAITNGKCDPVGLIGDYEKNALKALLGAYQI